MKKILIIEDLRSDFEKMRNMLAGTYIVLPEKYEEMSACIEYPDKVNKSIDEFVKQQIDENYKDLRLILCDIKFIKDMRGGNKVIKAIRNHNIPDAPNWTSFVPVVAVTKYAHRQESIIADGADFSLNKETIEGDNSLFSAIVETEIEKFEKLLSILSVYCLRKEKTNNNKVFIVHGRNDGVKEAVARVIKNLNLEPIILHEQPNMGRTIIEKFEANGSDVGFAIILLTADDLGRLKTEGEIDNKLRARQNVVFEMGYFMGLLSRSHVFILREDEIEEPSDLDGIVYNRLSESWQMKLVTELKSCGYTVDANSLC